MKKLSLLAGAVLALLVLPARAQSGAALLQKAEALDRANQFEAAQTAYNQASRAFAKAGDLNGQQKALGELAALDERLADQLLKSAGAPPAPAPAVPVRAVAPARAGVAAPVRPVAPAAGPAGDATQPLAGSVAGGRPVGLFFMSRYLMALHSLEKATYYFTPGGQVFVNPTGFSASSLASLPAGQRGSYTQAGSKLTVRWASGQTEDSAVEPQASTFGWSMGLFLAVRPFASAQQLVGSFEGGNSVSLGGGSTAVVSGLAFRPDGTYTRTGTSSISTGTDADGTAHAGASGTCTGRWSLNGWLLTLTSAQGQTIRGVAYPIETDDKTGQLTRFYYGSMAYKRL
ncbi:hypothetical protein GKZ68_03050 [Hymenobacter sp. BRD128]|uniref:hypothetical protein n=1 Tax=Hymenobacter sp. BRD128 TaxID=2675878 RepID=UPI00156522E6|nr:hypothetical protein [Hymenobacter sp. BRD128]QKG55707.1 hypothetical protein GKZ68_03050 [Hymenobacter sp. BRD128]